MNKTVTINISGIIFHIEEDAYEKLGSYLRTVRGRFTEEDGRDEIMADIESRIAEILNERVGPSKQVVLMADVDHVIAMMGEPEVISENDSSKGAGAETQEEDTYERGGRRRLYRDTDDKVIGGVCSGLGYYFDIDPIWIRLAFVIVFFVFGTGILFYILLLIIIPKAETTAEKLEMRREPVDVNNISKRVREEFDDLKKRAEDFGHEAKRYGKKWRDETRGYQRKKNRRSTGAEDFFQGVFHLIGRIFAFALVAVGIFFLIALVTSTISLTDFGNLPFGENVSSMFPDRFHYYLGLICFFIVFGIPTFMMIYKGIRMVFRINRKDKYVGLFALVIWVLGVIGITFAGVSVGKGFREEASVHEYFQVKNAKMDTIYLAVNVDPDMANKDFHSHWNHKYHFTNRWKAVSTSGNEVKFGDFSLQIIPSEVDSIQLIVYKDAYGFDKREAQERAKSISYAINQKDSLITFNSFYTLGKGQHWRGQNLRMELLVPKGKVVYFASTMDGLLDDITNTSNTLSEDMVDRRWKMTPEGLTCIDCAGLEIRKDNEIRVPVIDSIHIVRDTIK